MKILIIEDDVNIVWLIHKIIEDRNLGTVVGFALDGDEGIEKIEELNPDIVLIDLLMPGKDGISLVKENKNLKNHVSFIMISQVSSKNMISKAYEAGIEFYISKPINAVEVEGVIKKVRENIEMKHKLKQIKNLFSGEALNYGNSNSLDSINGHNNYNKSTSQEYDNLRHNVSETKKEIFVHEYEVKVKRILKDIGIISEMGTKDILKITNYLLENGDTMVEHTMKELCGKFSESPKSMEQRIRRAALAGLTNISSLGLENSNKIFEKYSTVLYNFEDIKREMDYMRRISDERGKVNVKKFIGGIIFITSME